MQDKEIKALAEKLLQEVILEAASKNTAAFITGTKMPPEKEVIASLHIKIYRAAENNLIERMKVLLMDKDTLEQFQVDLKEDIPNAEYWAVMKIIGKAIQEVKHV